jgi:hypothetical protein
VLIQRRALFVGAFLAAVIAAGCGGGSGPSPVAPSPVVSPGSSITSLVGVPTTAGTLSLPAIAGITPAFGLNSGAPAGLTMTATVSTIAPAGALPASNARRPQAATSASPSPAPTAPPSPFLFVTVTLSANVPASVFASEILTFASPGGAVSVNGIVSCQIDDLSTNPASSLGTLQGVVSGSTVTFSNMSGAALTGGHPYLFQFYVQPVSPAPSPTGSGSAGPSPSPTASGASPSPSPTASGATPAPSPTATATSSGTATAPPLFTFSGPSSTTASVTPPTAPGPLVAPAIGGYGTYNAHVTVQFGAPTSSAAFTLTGALGSTAADISPSSSFPYYTGSAATPLFYTEITPSAAVTFSQTPSINVTVSSFGSSNSCSLYVYSNTGGSAYQWVQVPGTLVNVTGTSVAIPASAPIGTLNLLPSQANLAFVGC